MLYYYISYYISIFSILYLQTAHNFDFIKSFIVFVSNHDLFPLKEFPNDRFSGQDFQCCFLESLVKFL